MAIGLTRLESKGIEDKNMNHMAPGWVNGRTAAAAHLGISERTISRWVRRGILQNRKLSKKLVLFRVKDLDDTVEKLARKYSETAN